jgi:hypothetical protein
MAKTISANQGAFILSNAGDNPLADLARAQVVKPLTVAQHPLTKSRRLLAPESVAKSKAINWLLVGQPAHARIRAVCCHQLGEGVPGDPLQQIIKHGILVPHGIAPSLSLNVANVETPLESMPCALYSEIEPDSRGLGPVIHDFGGASKDVDGRHKAGHDDEKAPAPHCNFN